jgi:putative Mg2+ transporter-C (MgtC) family protein
MISPGEMVLRLVLATAAGGAVGMERERLERGAGLRTHSLVCMGACLFMIVSANGFHEVVGHSGFDLDPSRVAAQVVSGIGFLGAGTIIFRRDNVKGITTAASIWVVAAIGLAMGGGLYFTTLGALLLALFILAVLKPVEERFFQSHRRRAVTLLVDRHSFPLKVIETAARRAGVQIKRMVIEPGVSPSDDRIDLVLIGGTGDRLSELVESLRAEPGLRRIERHDTSTTGSHNAKNGARESDENGEENGEE